LKPKAALQALNGLEKTEGWQLLQSIMEEEIVSSAMAIADKVEMSVDEINFRRGTIWAAKQMLNLPQRVRIKMENEVALDGNDKVASNINDVPL